MWIFWWVLIFVLITFSVEVRTPERSFLPLLDELLEILEKGGNAAKVSRLCRAVEAGTTGAPMDVLELANLSPGTSFERDLHRWAKKKAWSRFIPEIYEFSLPLAHGSGKHHALLPHELFHSIWSEAPELFKYLFYGSDEELLQWWSDAASVPDNTWYQYHPVIQEVEASRRIPFGIHGDDASMRGSESILVVSWGSVVRKMPTIESRLVFSMLKLRHILKDPQDSTMTEFYKVFVWSLQALSSGEFPSCDHNGVPFSNTYHPQRYAKYLSGEAIAGGWVGAFAEMRGDWKFLRESLHLQNHYGTDGVCHLCRAHKRIQRLMYTSCQLDAHHRRTIVKAWDWWYMMTCALLVSPLLYIPGFNVFRVIGDFLHLLDLGLYQHAVASAMWQLTSDSTYFEGRMKLNMGRA
jgi:hypothetical protein